MYHTTTPDGVGGEVSIERNEVREHCFVPDASRGHAVRWWAPVVSAEGSVQQMSQLVGRRHLPACRRSHWKCMMHQERTNVPHGAGELVSQPNCCSTTSPATCPPRAVHAATASMFGLARYALTGIHAIPQMGAFHDVFRRMKLLAVSGSGNLRRERENHSPAHCVCGDRAMVQARQVLRCCSELRRAGRGLKGHNVSLESLDLLLALPPRTSRGAISASLSL